MDHIETLELIRKYSDMNKLVFFVGAGVSKLSGFPSWQDLVTSMGDELHYAYRKTYDNQGNESILLSPDEYLKIPQMYHVAFGETKYSAKVKSSFSNECSPNEIHDLLLSLHPNHILTTNYDTLIEDTAIKFGQSYSIISSDKDISRTETTRYLVKVHGDFSSNFVLKESDYLNYEFNYQLISNLMKTIFATNLVVFIGYSLDDYNIKLILNWMQNIQKEQFVKPIFINTDDSKSETEKQYYFNRGISVLDSNDLLTEKRDYLTKYKTVLHAIEHFSPNPKTSNKPEVLEFLYNKVKEIRNLNYIKRSDFDKMFEPDFTINDEWKTEHLAHRSEMEDIWKDYFDYKNEYLIINKDKCDVIDLFVKSCGIRGAHIESDLHIPQIQIANISFINDYKGMIDYCSLTYQDAKEQFQKAYYLSKIGKLQESYNLYTEVLRTSILSKTWDIYYLSQINRYHLYSAIKHARTYYAQPFSVMSFGRIAIIDESFFAKMSLEMLHCDVETQFNELPYYFKRNHSFLANLSERNCYMTETNNLLQDKYEIEKSLTSHTMSTGLSTFDKIKLNMLESVKFIEDNMIYVQQYNESKAYIKNALLVWLRAYSKEINKTSSDVFSHICNSRLKFELQDILLLSKCCNIEDLKYFEENIDFHKIPFGDLDNLQSHILNLINYYNQKFSNDILMTEYLCWRSLCLEIQVLLHISSHYLKAEDITFEIIKFTLNSNDSYWSYQNRMQTIRKYVTINNYTKILMLLENDFITKVQEYSETNQQKFNNIMSLSHTMAHISSIWSYNFCDISTLVTAASEEKLNLLMPAVIPLASCLSLDAKTALSKYYKIETVWDLIKKRKMDKTFNISPYLHLINDYLKSKIDEINVPGRRRTTVPPLESKIRELIFFMIEQNCAPSDAPRYQGYWPEFDYFFNIDTFNSEDFNVEWLLYYNDIILIYIQQNDKMTSIAKSALKEMDLSLCKTNTSIWIARHQLFL